MGRWHIFVLVLLDEVKNIEEDLQSAFVSKSECRKKEYVGNKVVEVSQSDGKAGLKITRPVLIHKLRDEFDWSGRKNTKDTSGSWSGASQG